MRVMIGADGTVLMLVIGNGRSAGSPPVSSSAMQNLCLAASAMGLGAHVKSGGVMDDPRARAAVGVLEGQRIVATINVGEPASLPEPKKRRDASDLTTWVP